MVWIGSVQKNASCGLACKPELKLELVVKDLFALNKGSIAKLVPVVATKKDNLWIK